jgi:nucleotide-binding universal stress UspA family protein
MLVGLDGSLHSQAATDLGIAWAKRSEATVVGIGVIDEPTIRKPEITPIGAQYYKEHSDEVQLQHVTEKIEKLLAHFAKCCATEGVAYKERKETGDPAEQIALQSQRYDLILLGQKTWYQFIKQEEPCDTVRVVLKTSSRPVVVVPEKQSGGKSVVVLYDGSLQAARALQSFTQLGLATLGPVHLLTIDTADEYGMGNVERAAEYLWFHGIDATPHVLGSSNDVSQDLLEKAIALDAGLLVMGAYGQPALREFFVGSVTRHLLSESPVPLFVYH